MTTEPTTDTGEAAFPLLPGGIIFDTDAPQVRETSEDVGLELGSFQQDSLTNGTVCGHCGAPLDPLMGGCSYCHTTVPSTEHGAEIRRKSEAFLRALHKELNDDLPLSQVLALLAVPVPPLVSFFVLRWFSFGWLASMGISLGVAVVAVIGLGLYFTHHDRIKFERDIKARLERFHRKQRISKTELLDIAEAVLPADCSLLQELNKAWGHERFE